MMPREQFLLIRTKPYLHDDQTTTSQDVLHSLLSQQNAQNTTTHERPTDGVATYADISQGTGCDATDVTKLEPV